MKKNLLKSLLAVALLLVAGNVWGEVKSIEINTTNSGVIGSYQDKKFDVNNVTFGFTQWMKSTNIQAKKSTTNSLYNVDPIPGRIISIVVVQTGTARAIQIFGGTVSKPTTSIEAPATAAEMTFTFPANVEYCFFSLTTPGNACYFDKITINYEESSLKENDLQLSPEEFSLDLKKDDTKTKQITKTSSSSGAVLWTSSNEGVATVDENGLVTAVEVGTAVITAAQEATDEYQGGNKSCVVTVTDSRYSISSLIFTKQCGGSGTADDGNTWTITSDAEESEFDSNSGIHYGKNSGADVTFIQLSSSSNTGTIKKVVVNARDAQSLATISVSVNGVPFTTVGSTTVTNTSSDFVFNGSAKGEIIVRVDRGVSKSKALYVKSVVVYYEPGPQITASDVEIAYDATSGSLTYELSNPVNGGEVTAATESDWLTIGVVNNGTVSLSCSANNTSAARTAIVTLTYTYETNQTATKVVKVTQSGNPNVVNNISDITAAGTYLVKGTIVAKNARGFIVGDGTGYVYYYNQSYSQNDYNIGDKVKLSGSVVAYGGVFEFDNTATISTETTSNYQTEYPTVLSGSQMDERVASSDARLSDYVQYQGTLSVSGSYYNITNIDGATTAVGSISYPLNTDFSSLKGKTVKVTGYYVGVSSNKYYNTMIGSIEEIVVPTIAVSPASLTGFSYAVSDGPSVAKSISVSGANLNGTITLSLGDGSDYEISLSEESDYANSLSLSPSSGTVEATLVYFRLKAGLAIGEYTGNVTLSSPNATSVNVSLTGSVTAPSVTWDLSTNSYDGTPTEELISWSCDYAKMTNTKGTSATNVNNYIPTAQTSTRMYKNSILTITPVGNYKVRSVVFTATSESYASALANSTWTNATTQVSGKIVTVTPINGADAFVATIGAPCGFTAVQVYYEENTTPTIRISQISLEASCEGSEGVLPVTYFNITDLSSAYVSLCDEEGNATTYDWLAASIDSDKNVAYSIAANSGDVRTAYLKVIIGEVVSNIVIIAQARRDYVILPYTYDNTGAMIDNEIGLTQIGVSSYSASPAIKFDNTDDEVILKLNEAPKALYFDIKGNTFSGGTFTVQVSNDGDSYTDLAVYTELEGTAQTKYFSIQTNVRYIKWIYTIKSSGNVALGNIIVTKDDLMAYAVLSDDITTVDFYYDAKKSMREGRIVEIGEGDISVAQQWATASLTTATFDSSFKEYTGLKSTSQWFRGCQRLNEINGLENMNTLNVQYMSRMFSGCKKLKTIDLSSFNTGKVENMSGMFNDCVALESITFGENFNTENVTNMSDMFSYTQKLDTLDLSGFNTAKVVNMSQMFYESESEIIYVGEGWNTEYVDDSSDMFFSCDKLVGGAGTMWKTANPKDKTYACIDGGIAAPGYLTSKTAPATPGLSVGTGVYTEVQSVTISAEEGSTIYYTLDGTNPNAQNIEQVYTEAITISQTATLKAIAVKGAVSEVVEATYTIAIPAKKGDVNGDGSVDVADVTMLVSMILGNIPKNDAANVNEDAEGAVDVADVTALVSIILGQ